MNLFVQQDKEIEVMISSEAKSLPLKQLNYTYLLSKCTSVGNRTRINGLGNRYSIH